MNRPSTPDPQPHVQGDPLLIDTRITLFGNRLILKQLGLAFGLPVLLLATLLIALDWPPDPEALRGIGTALLIVVGVLVGLLLIGVGLVYGGRYEYHYRLDTKGIEGQTSGRTKRTNRVVNTLLMLSGRPGPMGAGMLAAGRQREGVTWEDVDQVVPHAKDHWIDLRENGHRQMAVFCPKERFDEMLSYAQRAVARAHSDESE